MDLLGSNWYRDRFELMYVYIYIYRLKCAKDIINCDIAYKSVIILMVMIVKNDF